MKELLPSFLGIAMCIALNAQVGNGTNPISPKIFTQLNTNLHLSDLISETMAASTILNLLIK